jgi:kynurenine 3-monooxygenase
MSNKVVHVVGGGLVGPLTAIFLAQKGINVELYERRGDIRKGEIEAGRSINLVITDRGLRALEKVGLKGRALEIAIPMKGRMLHDLDENTQFVPYGQKENELINAISRGLLNKLLLEAADEYNNLNIHFNKRCDYYDPDKNELTFTDTLSNVKETVCTEVVIGTDGAWSAIRKALLEKMMNFNYSQDFLEYGYKELIMPALPDGRFAMDEKSLHIWPRKKHMLIALPNVDGSFTCTLFYPYHGEKSFEMLRNDNDVEKFFKEEFSDALPLMPTLKEDFKNNPIGALATIKCNPWHLAGKALIMGDASHAIVPFYGQGMNCGFEDCYLLGELLDNNKPNWEEIFSKLNRIRKENTDAIADMAIENFVEMRETTADPKFQLKKQIGFELEKRYPEKFIPRYSMVMFHPEIPYAEAKRLSELQDNVLEKLADGINSTDQVNWDEAKILTEMLTR